MTYYDWIILALFAYVTLLGIYILYIDHTYISREKLEEMDETIEENNQLLIDCINKINERLGIKARLILRK